MRILANYGYKANGEMYSVTFETIGDVPAAQASQTVDELFRLAKEAVQRQLAGASPKAAVQPTPAITIPQPQGAAHAASAHGNGRKPQIKEPGLPATPKQVGLLQRLAREKGQWIEHVTDLTRGEASAKIEELMAL